MFGNIGKDEVADVVGSDASGEASAAVGSAPERGGTGGGLNHMLAYIDDWTADWKKLDAVVGMEDTEEAAVGE